MRKVINGYLKIWRDLENRKSYVEPAHQFSRKKVFKHHGSCQCLVLKCNKYHSKKLFPCGIEITETYVSGNQL